MKNEEQSQTFQHNPLEQQTKHINCAQNNQAELLCTNDECSHFAFLCTQNSCNCHIMHESCVKLTIKSLITALQKKRITFESIKEKIKEEVQKAIDYFQKLETVLLTQCQQKSYDLTGLTSDQKVFMKAISKGQVDKITGKIIWNIQLNLKKPQQTKRYLEKIQLDMKNFWNQLSNEIKKLETNVKNKLQNFGKNIMCNLFDVNSPKQRPEPVKPIIIGSSLKKQATFNFEGAQKISERESVQPKRLPVPPPPPQVNNPMMNGPDPPQPTVKLKTDPQVVRQKVQRKKATFDNLFGI